MAEIALLASAVSAAGTVVGGMAAKREGQAQASAMRQSAEFEAARLREKANEERAAAGREAAQERDKKEQMASRAIAVAASSGGGVENPTILNILDDIETKGELQAGQKMYVGKSRAAGMIDQANAGLWNADVKGQSARNRGDAAFVGSLLEGFGTAAGGVYKYKTAKGWG